METVSKSQLKAGMFKYFRRLGEQGGSLIVTDHGRPVLKIERVLPRPTVNELFASYRGRVKIDRMVALESVAFEWKSDD